MSQCKGLIELMIVKGKGNSKAVQVLMGFEDKYAEIIM